MSVKVRVMDLWGERARGMLNRRRSKRASVVLPASLITMSAYQYLELIDLSATGAKLRGSMMAAVSMTALFRLDDFQVLCKVVWATDGVCGVRFDEPIPPRVLAHFNKTERTAEIEILTAPERQLPLVTPLEFAGHADPG